MRNGRKMVIVIVGLVAATAALVTVILIVAGGGSTPPSQSPSVHSYYFEGTNSNNPDEREELNWTWTSLNNQGTIKGSYTDEVKSDAGRWEKDPPTEFTGFQNGDTIYIPGHFFPNLNVNQVVGKIGRDGSLRLENVTLGINTDVLRAVPPGR